MQKIYKKKAIPNQIGRPISEEDIEKLFKSNEIFGYKFARSTDTAIGNSTKYVHHEEGKWIRGSLCSKHGLFFFVDTKFLLPYMTYGDILVRIRIRKSDVPKMKIKVHENGIIQEYSCRKYYVDKIMVLSDEETLRFIAEHADKQFASIASWSIDHLKKLWVDQNVLFAFERMLIKKGIDPT